LNYLEEGDYPITPCSSQEMYVRYIWVSYPELSVYL